MHECGSIYTCLGLLSTYAMAVTAILEHACILQQGTFNSLPHTPVFQGLPLDFRTCHFGSMPFGRAYSKSESFMGQLRLWFRMQASVLFSAHSWISQFCRPQKVSVAQASRFTSSPTVVDSLDCSPENALLPAYERNFPSGGWQKDERWLTGCVCSFPHVL